MDNFNPMGKGTLTVYSASAGSGKTYKLTGIYLAALFRSRYNYRKILAVTFTNKATAEMKSRILENLHKLGTGEHSDYLQDLMTETGKSEEQVRFEAAQILNSILHDFSRFSVCTIDSFFQKILRAFAKEAGLHSGFNIELDHSIILSSAVDELIASSVDDDQLKRWLTEYVNANIEEEKGVNLKTGIVRLSEELFREKFKTLSEKERSDIGNKEFLQEYIRKVRAIVNSIENKLVAYGKEAQQLFAGYELTDDMFFQKSRGVPGFIRSMAAGIVKAPNSYVREIESDPPKWIKTSFDVSALEKVIKDAIHFIDRSLTDYKTAQSIQANIYALGILSDVLLKVHGITTNENSFLLSDAGEVLNLITEGDQCPFIYEKVGNRFENYMIDEFQDTSVIQWNNFRPLIENTMAEGCDNLVVGDVKQSIYRWRNSDWRILGDTLESKIDNERYLSVPLITNWRSRTNLITFNNLMFTIIPSQVDQRLSNELMSLSFRKLYAEAVQEDPGKRHGGYIRMEFIEEQKDRKWQSIVLERLPGVIESFQNAGFSASDIGIIVRDGREGSLILQTLIDYGNACPPEKKLKYNFNAVSNDSLLLCNSPAIKFIIAVLSVVNDPADMISRAVMLRLFLLAKGETCVEKIPLVNDKLGLISGSFFPDGFEIFIAKLREMPLFEATENIIRFFKLGDYSWNVAYLNTFQDYILNFSSSSKADIQSFLDWWETTGNRKSVVLPGNQNAMRILTIHKSKGLEFKVVLLPFLCWDLDYPPGKQPVLWVKPGKSPFNDLGIVPVKYCKELSETIFADDYESERYSVFVDNINLLYVALTRAKDAMYGFSFSGSKSEGTVAGILKNAITADGNLNNYFLRDKGIFEYGSIPENKREDVDNNSLTSSVYQISQKMDSLRLKLHGENYFSDNTEVRKRINYGKLMHEVFEGITTAEDVSPAIKKLIMEGKLSAAESGVLEQKINELIRSDGVSEWFMAGNKVMKEAAILLPSGLMKRPDRVILRDGKTIIVDFKFGEENPHYAHQLNQYRKLLTQMGYENIEAFIWYVDNNQIVKV